MSKMIVFDMDGTLFDTYAVNGWLDDLHAFNVRPYAEAKAMYGNDLIEQLNLLKALGWKVAVTSWLAGGSTKEYDKAVRKVKKEKLDEINFPYDEIHLVKYGTPKTKCTRGKADYQILVDDNESVREHWTLGDTIDAREDIRKEIAELIVRTYFER